MAPPERALDGIPAPTALHLCFGYAYVARDKPTVYAFLPKLTASKVEQISIEAAQPNLDLTTLDGFGGKTVIFVVISMGDPSPATPDMVAGRIRAALKHLPPERLIPAPDCGMKYIPRDFAFAKLKALAERAAIVRRELVGVKTVLSLTSASGLSVSSVILARAATGASIDNNSGASHANMLTLGAAAIVIRVGRYTVRPGHRGDDRESSRISPQLVDELFAAAGGGAFNGLYPDIGAVRDAARIAAEVAGAPLTAERSWALRLHRKGLERVLMAAPVKAHLVERFGRLQMLNLT